MGNEAKMILIQRLIKIDNKIRTDHTYPAGLMDVVSIEKTKETFRLLYDTKGRFVLRPISPEASPNHVKFENGNLCMVIGGNNMGRVGVLQHREKHHGSHEIVHLKDKTGHAFATRIGNVMVIGRGEQRWITLPKGEGIAQSNMDDRRHRMEVYHSRS